MAERGGEGLRRVREAGGGPEDLTQDEQITDDQRTPAASASITASPKPSLRKGNAKTSAAATSDGRSDSGTAPRTTG